MPGWRKIQLNKMESKAKYNYCDIITHAGNHKFLAKVKTSMQKDGTATFGPSEVLVEGVWRPIKEFAVHWPNYSCNDYRQTEQVQMEPQYTHCTVTTLHSGNFNARVGERMDSDGIVDFGPVGVWVDGEWMPIGEFQKKYTFLQSIDYRIEEETEEPMPVAPRGSLGASIAEKTDTTITTTFTPQEPYNNVPPPASFEFKAVSFGLRVYLHRESLLLSRRKAADQIGITESAVAAIEAGIYHGIDEIAKAAKWLELSASEMGGLFGLKDQEQPKKSWSGTTTILVLLFILAWIIVWNL